MSASAPSDVQPQQQGGGEPDPQVVQSQFNQYAAQYPIELAWPPVIVASSAAVMGQEPSKAPTPPLPPPAPPRTSKELIHHRLWEAGVLAEVPVPLEQTLQSLNEFVQNMERTGCYNSVHVQLEPSSSSTSSQQQQQQTIRVQLNEKNWYRLHAGGAVKTDELFGNTRSSGSGGGESRHHDLLGVVSLPAAELEVSAGLRNLSGTTDVTNLAYTLDTHQISSWSLTHERPFYTLLPNPDAFLVLANGSQIALQTRAFLQTIDHEWTRSYKEYQRGFWTRVANHHSMTLPEKAPGVYWGLTYQAVLRDIVPKRMAAPLGTNNNAKSPLLLIPAMDASHAVCRQAGPSLKHSIGAEMRQNGTQLDDAQLPTSGWDWNVSTELALPTWGDVSFWKTEGHVGYHLPILSTATGAGLALHSLLNAGYLHQLLAGGNQPEKQQQHTISDRFFLGGPMNFRGFLPSGVGPRESKPRNGSDALGGDFYYTWTAMASLPLLPTADNEEENTTTLLGLPPMRAFVFGTVGTCVGSLHYVMQQQRQQQSQASSSSSSSSVMANTVSALYRSSRVSAGLGVATQVLGSRLELTYAVPLHFGPSDYRRNVQLGMSVALDR